MKKIMKMINETKSWFFEKVNKIDKPLETRQEKKGKDSIKMNKEKLPWIPQKYKGS